MNCLNPTSSLCHDRNHDSVNSTTLTFFNLTWALLIKGRELQHLKCSCGVYWLNGRKLEVYWNLQHVFQHTAAWLFFTLESKCSKKPFSTSDSLGSWPLVHDGSHILGWTHCVTHWFVKPRDGLYMKGGSNKNELVKIEVMKNARELKTRLVKLVVKWEGQW